MSSTAKWGQRPRRQTEARHAVVPPGATKRLNVDLSLDLHARLKVACARQGIANVRGRDPTPRTAFSLHYLMISTNK